MAPFVYIKDDEISNLLQWDEVYDATKTALLSICEARAKQNPRTITENLASNQSKLLTMPGCLNDEKYGALACKLVTLFPDNSNLNPPQSRLNAIITLFDEKNGSLKALMDGCEITKWRTAAASVIATKYLTIGKDLRIASILGSGEQGRIHAEAFLHFFNFQEIRIWNHRREPAQILVDELNIKAQKKVFRVAETSRDCVQDADVIVTATFAKAPIIELNWLKTGVHINDVGVNATVPSEIAADVYLNSDIFIDHWDGANTELKPLQSLGCAFKGEIGQLINGTLQPPQRADRITIFDSLGMAVEDCAVARLIHDKYINQKKQ